MKKPTRNTLALGSVAGIAAVVLAALLSRGQSAVAAPAPQAELIAASAGDGEPQPEPKLAAEPISPDRPLTEYLAGAALTWLDLPECDEGTDPETWVSRCRAFYLQERERPEDVRERVWATARTIARVMRGERPIWPSEPKTHDGAGVRSGLTLMSIGFNETRFRKFVTDGRCNDADWRRHGPWAGTLLKLGTCDSGRAFTAFQIQPGVDGICLWDDVGEFEHATRERCKPGGRYVDGPTMLEHFDLAVTAALHMARKSIRATGTLADYTGEGGAEAHPAADRRLRLADDYLRRHPFELPRE
jgi:hypothetical protein